MPLNEVSFAISPYIARANKALKFYQINKNKTLATGNDALCCWWAYRGMGFI